MQLSSQELDRIIKEEINEIFGRGKKQPSKEYPASELATIIKGLNDASKLSGAELTDSQREAIVDELTGVLKDEGFVIKEDERLFTGEEDVMVTHQNAPKLKVFLDTVAQKNPKVFKQLLGLFNRSALDISPVVKSLSAAPASPAPAPASPAAAPASPAAAPASPIGDKKDQAADVKDAFTYILKKNIDTISRKDNARLKAFLQIAQVSGIDPGLLPAMAAQFGVRDPALLDNLPPVKHLPDGIQQLVRSVASQPHIATSIFDGVRALFKMYRENPQLIVSEPAAKEDPDSPRGTPQDDEDQTATVKYELTTAPEEAEDYIDDIEQVTDDTPGQDAPVEMEPDPVTDPDSPARKRRRDIEIEFNKFFSSLDDDDYEEIFNNPDLSQEDFMWGTMGIDEETLSHIFDIGARANPRPPRDIERSRAALEADQEAKLKIYNTDPELVSDLIANAQQRMLNYAKGIATKRARLKEHKEFNRMKVLAGVK